MDREIRAVDRTCWDDVTTLFGPNGISRGCWCMARRLSAKEYGSNAENRAALRDVVDRGEPVGLIGYLAGDPVAWCSVAPRPAFQPIVRSRAFPIDDPDDDTIWSVNCIFVKAGYRKNGYTTPIIEAAVDYAARNGARIVEAYPAETMPGDISRGLLSMFLDADFAIYERDRTTSKRHVVVRRTILR